MTSEVRFTVTERRLVAAFCISLAVHLMLLGAYRVAPGAFRSAHNFLAPLLTKLLPKALVEKSREVKPPVQAQLQKKPPEPEKPQVIPLSFIEVDPALAVLDTPKNAKYYSSQSTLAANPDFKKQEDKPKIEGKQERVPRLASVPRNPQPLQPSPPRPPAEVAKVETPPQAATPPPQPVPPPPTPEPPPEPPKPKSTIGDLAMLKASETPPPPKVVPAAQPDAPMFQTSGTRRTEAVRPRTLAQAFQQDPRLAGEVMKQDGGVARRGRIAVDAAASPLGDYDREFIAAVERCWYALLEDRRYMLDCHGKVVIDFKLNYDGRLSELLRSHTDAGVGDLMAMVCELALTKPAPYQRWPGDMRRLVGKDYRDVRFTFYYD